MQVDQLRELLTTKLDHQTETLGRIERQTTKTNGRADELERQMAIANALLAVAVERLNAHDREIRDLKKNNDAVVLAVQSANNVTWRDARRIVTATALGCGTIWGLVQGAIWLYHNVVKAS